MNVLASGSPKPFMTAFDARYGVRVVGLAMALALIACTGSVNQSGAGGGGTSGTGTGNGGTGAGVQGGTTGGGMGGMGGTAGTVAYPAGGPPPTAVPLRRLTNSEYAQAAADLFSTFTLPAPSFIPDSKVFNFLNISSSQLASQVLLEQYEGAAQLITIGDSQTPHVWTGVTADPTKLTGCNVATSSEMACAQPYLYALAKRAYRRPLADAEKTALWALFSNAAGGTYQNRLALAIQGILLSPNFIFRPEFGDRTKVVSTGIVQLTPWELANRLSFFITGSMPDADLMAAADSGALSDVANVRTHVQRLMALPRSQANLVKLHEEWLGVDNVNTLTKNATAFPSFTSLTAAEMGLETRTFVQKVMFEQGGTFADLLTAPYTFGNGDIANLYGATYPGTDKTQFVKIDLDQTRRRGLLTQLSVMATLTKDSAVQDLGTAIRRGKFVLQQILCRPVPEPSAALTATFQPLDLTKTTRSQAGVHENSPVCSTCHTSIDPLGLPFENYDMIGRWRDTDQNMPIDARGQILDSSNANPAKFNGVPELAQLIATRDETRACYLQQWFQFSNGKLVAEADQPYLNWLSQKFTATQKLVDMVVTIVTSDSFRQLKLDPTAGM